MLHKVTPYDIANVWGIQISSINKAYHVINTIYSPLLAIFDILKLDCEGCKWYM